MSSVAARFPRPSVMGIVNVTPDSFSDGGVNLDPAVAAANARGMVEDGAALVDVGGESTRPGAERRLAGRGAAPRRSRARGDRRRAAGLDRHVQGGGGPARALELGAIFVNDVTALRGDPELAGVVAESGAFLCLMHMLGEPRTMQDDPRYDDVVSEVARFLEERLAFAVGEGIPEERICLDPGIGFGKTVEHNVELIARLGEIAALGRPVVVGASRKRFLGRLLGDTEATTGPVAAGIGAAVTAYERGATMLRVHDVRPACRGPRRRGRGGAVSRVTIELHGLELHGFHGVLEEERRDGQTFLFDLELDADVAGAQSDDLAGTIDYREIVACVREISDGRAFQLLEALAEALADALLARFPRLPRTRARAQAAGPARGAGRVHGRDRGAN